MLRLVASAHRLILLCDGSRIVVGRGQQCDVRLKDPSVSRVHCRIEVTDNRAIVIDLQSRWGTHVNGQQISRAELTAGDRLRIGETTFVVEPDVVTDETTPPTGACRDILIKESPVSRTVTDDHQRNSYVVDASMNNATPDDLSSERFLGRQFANYNVNSLIAKTHSGLVFQARSQTSDRFVALRILARSTLDTEAAEERFRRATTTVKKLNHPNIVQLLDAGRTQGYCYTVSQLIEGENAVDLIRRIGVVGMLDAASVLQIAVDLCEALRCIESHGILHRNIKPSNILITESNGRKVALLDDLVLAKTLGSSRQKQLTKAGELIGDVGYMSPEQLGSGFPVDQRSDIYQLGVTLYALLTGRELFSTGTMAHRMGAVLTELPPPIRSIQMATPPQFESLVLKMLKKNPSERFQNANELADALRQLAAVLNQSSVRPQERSPKDQGWSGGLEGLF